MAQSQKEKKNKIINKYKMRSDPSHRARVLRELGQEDVIAILGKYPTYIHSAKENFLVGLKTSNIILNRELNVLIGEIKKKINTINKNIDTKIEEVMRFCNKKTWQEFKQWWENDMVNINVSRIKNDTLYYLGVLSEIKKLQSQINLFHSVKNTSFDKLSKSQQQQLINLGFVSSFDDDGKPEYTNAFKEIRTEKNQLVRDLVNYMSTLGITNGHYIDNLYQRLLKKQQKSDTVISATDIGNLEEFLTEKLSNIAADGISARFEIVAAEKTGNKNPGLTSKTFKADTDAILSNCGVEIHLLMSDKTGMSFLFGDPGQIPEAIDSFTSGISSGVSFQLFNEDGGTTGLFDAGIVQDANIDKKVDDIFQYVLRNADVFKMGIKDTKDIIVCFFVWLDTLVKTIGDYKNENNIPPIIKFFNRIYRMSDLLRLFANSEGTQILKFVQKSYLTNFYKITTASFDKNKLYSKKRGALRAMNNNVTYPKLKGAINGALGNIYAKMPKKTFSTSFKIAMSNLDNIK